MATSPLPFRNQVSFKRVGPEETDPVRVKFKRGTWNLENILRIFFIVSKDEKKKSLDKTHVSF